MSFPTIPTLPTLPTFSSFPAPLSAKLPMNLPLLKNYSIVGVFTGAWGERFPDEYARAADTVMTWVGEGKLRPSS